MTRRNESCPECGSENVAIDDDKIGTEIECPDCGHYEMTVKTLSADLTTAP